MLTTVNPSATADTPLLDIVMDALQATWRIPDVAPRMDLPPSFTRDALRAFTIERVAGGYVANIEFDVAPDEPNTIGTPDADPLPTHRHAFIAGAALVCEVVSGSRGLPFLVTDDELVVVTVTSTGKPLMMRRPFPMHGA